MKKFCFWKSNFQRLFIFLDNKKYLDRDNNWLIYFIFKNGGFTIDSWFFINGALLTQLFYKSSKEFGITNHNNISHHFKHLVFMYFYKVAVIILPLFVTSKILLISMKHFNENSILSFPSNDHLTCDENVFQMLFDIYTPPDHRVSTGYIITSVLVKKLSDCVKTIVFVRKWTASLI